MSKMSELHAEIQQAGQFARATRLPAQPLVNAIQAMCLPIEMFFDNRGGGFLGDDEKSVIMDHFIATAWPRCSA